MARLDWVRLPTNWIVEKRTLLNFRWQKDNGANRAALMTLIVLAHHADDNGTGELIYD